MYPRRRGAALPRRPEEEEDGSLDPPPPVVVEEANMRDRITRGRKDAAFRIMFILLSWEVRLRSDWSSGFKMEESESERRCPRRL